MYTWITGLYIYSLVFYALVHTTSNSFAGCVAYQTCFVYNELQMSIASYS